MAAFKKSWRGDDAAADSAVPQHARDGPLHHQLRPLRRRERSKSCQNRTSPRCALWWICKPKFGRCNIELEELWASRFVQAASRFRLQLENSAQEAQHPLVGPSTVCMARG